ncbi:uncharacterized protein N7482_010470 [Penicillium canariense]|uniref:FAD-binding FR-type domain-containing protein n=1 Tax=Penicillium canariense TaxID=189055 RepID=A0A9W9HJV2_9EURO|nr:uncharacterized protein N7482_010470 [Penicillium canariense]KAJ5151218.1 hypothetical protein N7482_010470 [Penicillium canariense]
MRVFFPSMLAIAIWGTTVWSADMPKNQQCLFSVYLPISSLPFPSSESSSPHNGSSSSSNGSYSLTRANLGAVCQGTLALTSVYAGGLVYCSSSEVEAGFEYIRQICAKSDYKLPDLTTIAKKLTDNYISSLKVINSGDISANDTLTVPVLISSSYFRLSYRSVDAWYGGKSRSLTYCLGVYGFWAGILGIGMLYNLLNSRSIYKMTQTRSDIEQWGTPSKLGPTLKFAAIHHWVQTNFIVPSAIGSYRRRLLFGCTIPTRMESLAVGSFWALVVALNVVGMDVFSESLMQSNVSWQAWQYVSDRTGILSYATLPVLWMFAGRNNIFLWATGWNFQTFNIFHRHVARIGTLLAIVHSVAYTVVYAYYVGTYRNSLKEAWFVLGFPATVAMSALCLLTSWSWLRRRFYEVFLQMHILLSVVVVAGVFVHTSKFYGTYDPPPLGTRRNLVLRPLSPPASTPVATYHEDFDIIRLEVRPVSPLVNLAPGQFFFLYQPFSWRGYENHPFSLAAWKYESSIAPRKGPAELVPSKGTGEKEFSIHIASTSSTPLESPSSNPSNLPTPTQPRLTLTFLIRPCDGWTRRVRDSCKKSNGVCTSTFLFEGPYGHSAPLYTFDTVIMVVGGTGISGAVPYILDHISRTQNGSKDLTRITRISLVWASSHRAVFQNICGRELAPAMGREDFEAKFFCTCPLSPYTGSKESASLVESTSSAITVHTGRPDVESLIAEAARGASASERVCVFACGPANMADDARAAVHRAMNAGSRIEYFEEAYGW